MPEGSLPLILVPIVAAGGVKAGLVNVLACQPAVSMTGNPEAVPAASTAPSGPPALSPLNQELGDEPERVSVAREAPQTAATSPTAVGYTELPTPMVQDTVGVAPAAAEASGAFTLCQLL